MSTRDMDLAESLAAARDEEWDRELEAERFDPHELAEGESPRWTCDQPDKAEWAVRKLGALRARTAEAEKLALAEKALIDAWLAAEKARVAHDVDFFEGLLRQYHEDALAHDPRRKTIYLPSGTLKARAQQPEITVLDENAFLMWARERPQFVRVKESPALSELRRVACAMEGLPGDQACVLVDGEIIPGVVAVIRPVKFTAVVERREER